MFKKGISAAAILAATTSLAFAGGPEVPPAPAYVGGFYLGVGLSRDDIRADFHFDQALMTAGQLSPESDLKINSGATGWNGQLMLGYGHVWDNEYYLGAEIWGDYSSLSATQWRFLIQIPEGPNTSYSRVNFKLTSPWTFGFALMPGYYAAPGSLFYARLAYVNTEFNLFGNAVVIPGSPSSQPWPTFRKNESGFQFGVGTDTQVGRHLSFREEYVWQTYGNLSKTQTTNPEANGDCYINSVKIEPVMENFNFALIYRFATQGNAPDLSAAPAHVGGHFYAGLAGSRDNIFSYADYRISRFRPNANGPFQPTDPTTTFYNADSGFNEV